MKLSEYRNIILNNLPNNPPYGESVSDKEEFDFIESQLMKVGSLAHEDINWQQVEKNCIVLLGEIGKDFKVLSALMQTLQYQTTPEKLNLSIAILADFVREYWESPFPFSGSRAKVGKQRLLGQIIERSIKAFEQLDPTTYDEQDKNEFTSNISLLKDAITARKIEYVDFDRLEVLPSRISLNAYKNKRSNSSSQKDDESLQMDSVEYADIPKTKVVFDSSDERMLKKSLNSMASFLLEMKQWDIVLKIRRLALWHTINSAPSCNDVGETELASVPIDKIAEYKESLAQASLELWEKIENSISLSPFWFDGHFLSYQVAMKLGYSYEAGIIKTQLQTFIKKVPQVKNLKFKGNIPFLSQDTLAWIESDEVDFVNGDDGVKSTSNNNHSLSEMVTNLSFATDLQKEVLIKLEAEGFDKVVMYLNNGLELAKSQREKCYWKLALAGVYKKVKLDALANNLYQDVADIICSFTVKEWEPYLVEQLIMFINPSIIQESI